MLWSINTTLRPDKTSKDASLLVETMRRSLVVFTSASSLWVCLYRPRWGCVHTWNVWLDCSKMWCVCTVDVVDLNMCECCHSTLVNTNKADKGSLERWISVHFQFILLCLQVIPTLKGHCGCQMNGNFLSVNRTKYIISSLCSNQKCQFTSEKTPLMQTCKSMWKKLK